MHARMPNLNNLRVPNQPDMAAMKSGEVRIFRIGSSLTAMQAVRHKIGGDFSQNVILLVDPKTAETFRCVAVQCIVPCPQK